MRFFQLCLLYSCLFMACVNSQYPVVKKMVYVKAGVLKTDHGIKNIAPFYMDRTPVTVAAYREFVEATQYQTEAERLGEAAVYNFEIEEWELRKGAYWQYPMGKEKPMAVDNHPVTQVSWNDAMAYCQWAGKQLPTQWQWEYAARNARNDSTNYPWGNVVVVKKRYKANCWQGTFPSMNLVEDGFRFTSPVGYYGKSPLGLVDLAGNVWEWTTTKRLVQGAKEYVQKGGSFMCEASVCHGYKISASTSATPETGLFHVGFRCIKVP